MKSLPFLPGGSPPDEIACLPSGEYATAQTISVWSRKQRNSSPLSTSQSRTVRSVPPKRPTAVRGECDTPNGVRMLVEDPKLHARVGIPHTYGAVAMTGGEDAFPVRRLNRADDKFGVPHEFAHGHARQRVPKAEAVICRRKHGFTIGQEGYLMDIAARFHQLGEYSAGLHIPDPDRVSGCRAFRQGSIWAISRRRDAPPTIGRECHTLRKYHLEVFGFEPADLVSPLIVVRRRGRGDGLDFQWLGGLGQSHLGNCFRHHSGDTPAQVVGPAPGLVAVAAAPNGSPSR